jgi:hypothetical protein
VAGGYTSSDGSIVVQPPWSRTINVKSESAWSSGTYQVDVSLTKATTGDDDGQRVKAAQITVRVDPVQGASGKLVGAQQIPDAASKIPLVVGISAKHGDFRYYGSANLNVTITGPNGAKGGFSVPVDLQRGNPGAPSVVGVSGGRTTFVVP